MTAAAWTLLLLLPSAPGDGCPQWQALIGGGGSLQQRSSDGSWGPTALASIGAGAALDRCLAMPLRAEVDLFWDSRGSPWGDGVEAVEVARLGLELTALAGLQWRVAGDDRLGLDLEALTGPTLRWVRVATRVLTEERVSHDLQPRLTFAAGPAGHWDRLRLALRARSGLPWDDSIGAMLIVGMSL